MRRSDTEPKDEFDEADLFSDVAFCQPSNLSFADHVHCFIALDRSLCARERAKAEARPDPPFDRTVILLDNVIQIRDDTTATSLAECMRPLQFVNERGYDGFPSTLITLGRG
jgi:hypothetical protein